MSRTKGAKDLKPRKRRSANLKMNEGILRFKNMLESEMQRLTWIRDYNAKSLKQQISTKLRKKNSDYYNSRIFKIEKFLKSIDESKLRPSVKALDFYEAFTNLKMEQYKIIGQWDGYRLDEDSSYNQLVLKKLAEQGFDVFNPTKLYNLFKQGNGHVLTLDEIKDWIAYEGEEIDYERLNMDAEVYIRELVHKVTMIQKRMGREVGVPDIEF